LSFKRRGFFKETTNVHIDYSLNVYGKIHTSIILPIEGCNETNMYWMDGDYYERYNSIENLGYLNVDWLKKPNVVDRVEIFNNPVIARVDTPHSVTSRTDGGYRTVLTIRLNGNPEFDDVLNRYLSKQPV